MPIPEETILEMVQDAPQSTKDKWAYRVAKKGTHMITQIYKSSVSEQDLLVEMAKQDLNGLKLLPIYDQEIGSDEDLAVRVSQLIASTYGLTQIAMFRKTLSQLSSQSEKVNANRAEQILAWFTEGIEAETSRNKALVRASKMRQIPAMIGRAVRTPYKYWKQEVGVLFETGGGIGSLGDTFAGTPVEGIIRVIRNDLLCSLALREAYLQIGRLREDAQLEAMAYKRVAHVSAEVGQKDLEEFGKAETTYLLFQSELEGMRVGGKMQKISQEYMAKLEKLTKANDKALSQYQEYQRKVRSNPDKIENAVDNLLQGLRLAESLGNNEMRLMSLSRQFNEMALLKANQLNEFLLGLSSMYCERIAADVRATRERMFLGLESTHQAIEKNKFESYPQIGEQKSLLQTV